tara:strand:+ start:420 stop:641 length:222 start_codon:yes stop_codon:yes gene_type:complete
MSARPRESRTNLSYSLLNELLHAEKVTNRALGKYLNKTETTISLMRHGKRDITRKVQSQIYQYLASINKKGDE